MTLAAREEELTVLRGLLTEAGMGQGYVVVVTGPVACGKTALSSVFAEHAVLSGATHLSAIASWAERAVPFGVVDQLFNSAAVPRPSVDRVARLLDEGMLFAMVGNPATDLADRVPARILHGLCVALPDLIQAGPLVLVIDDIQFADAASLQFVSYLVRALRSLPALVIVNETVGARPAHPLFRAELLRQPHCRRLRLKTLPATGVAAMLGQRTDPETAARLAPGYHVISGGNPLLVRGLMADNPSGGQALGVPVVGDGFHQAVAVCLHRCEPIVLKVAQGLAILGNPCPPNILTGMLRLEPESVVGAIDALGLAGLLSEGWFRHEVARAAVLDGMLPDDRTQMRARAARSLAEAAAPAAVVAPHLLASHDIEGDWVVPVLHEAAEQALAGPDVDLAINCLRLASEVGTEERQRARSKAALAQTEWRLDPSAAMRHTAELLGFVQRGHLTGPLAVALVDRLLWFGRVEDAEKTLGVLGASADALDADAREALDSMRLWLRCLYPLTAEGTSGLAGNHRSHHPTDPGVPAIRSLADVLARGAGESRIAGAERMLAGNPLSERTLNSIVAAIATLVHTDSLTGAARWCESLLKEAETRRAPTWRGIFTAMRAAVALRQGDLRGAETHARQALHLIPARSWGVAVGVPLSTLLQVTTAMGRYDAAFGYLRTEVPDALFETPIGLLYLQARGRYFHATGYHCAALAEFQLCGDLMATWHMDLPALVPWRSDAAVTNLRLGNRRRARELVIDQLDRLAPAHVRTRAITQRVLAAASDLAERPALLRQAAEALNRCGDRLELARALADLGVAYDALGQRGQARSLLRRAHRLARQCGAVSRSGTLPDCGTDTRPPEKPRKPAGDRFTILSEAERRVAALAADGHTNRQIADHLHVTASTVEQHLTRVYRKLKVHSRSDLPLGIDTAGPLLESHRRPGTPLAPPT